MPYIGRDLNRGNYLKLDDISSSFNGSTQTFNLTVGGSAFTPGSAFSILVSVGGVIQEPESAYQVNNSEITFANAPTAQDGFFCIALATPIGIGVPGNGTVNGTQMAKPFNYDGYFYLDDANNRVGIGSLSPTVELDVSGTIKASSFSGPIGNPSGISTFYDLRVTNNLTVEGTTSTLDTDLIGVDRVEVGANSNSIVGVAVTQSGTADIVNLFDGSTEVLTVIDGGNVGINSTIPTKKLDVNGTAQFQDDINIKSGNPIILGNAANSASTQILCDGGARLHLKSYNQTVATFEEGVGTVFYQGSGTNRLQITPTGGVVVGAGGTIKIPDKIMHVGDENTAIRFPAADQISFETGGTNRLKIHTYSSNNHVELDASTHLSLADNGSNGRFIYIGDANASSTGYMHLQPGAGSQGFGGGIRLFSHANSTNAGGVYIGKSLNSSGAIIFGNGGMTPSSEYLRIASNGNVSIGNNPTVHADNIFHVEDSGETNVKFEGDTTTIGARLQLQNNNTAAGALNQIDFNDAGGQSTSSIKGFNTDQTNNYGELAFFTRSAQGSPPAERLRITSGGLIKINSASPVAGTNGENALLQVKSLSQYDGLLLGHGYDYGTISRGASNSALIYTANASPGNLGGGEKIMHEWWSGSSGGGGPNRLMVLSSSGRLGINEASPDGELHIKGTNPFIYLEGTNGSGRQHKIWSAGTNSESLQLSSGNLLFNGDVHYFRASNETTEYLRIDSSARILYGLTSNFTGAKLQLNLGAGGNSINIFAASNDANASFLDLYKTRGTTPTNYTALQDGDFIGQLRFRGATGSSYVNGAVIQAKVNGTTGSGNDLPTDLIFRLQPDGSGNTNEVFRISSSGKVLVGNGNSVSPSRNLDVRGSGHQQILIGSTNNSGASLMLDGHGGGDGSGGNYGTVEMGSDGHLDIRNYDPAKNIVFGVGSNVGGNDSVIIKNNGYFGVGQAPNTKVNAVLSAFAATGDDDASDWGANGIFQLDHSGTAATNNEVLLLGAVSGAVGQIASGFGFGRESTSNWGTYISFKTHSTSTANIDELKERARLKSDGTFEVGYLQPADGSSAVRAAKSALEIKKYYPQKESGNYWILDRSGIPRQIYCEMETDGGGWMLWHDHNAPGSKTSMNIALGGSDSSPSSNLSRSYYNNYARYTVWIKASQIDATGERLHSFVTLDNDGELKYVADYGVDFLYEDVGDQYQPNLNAYFNSGASSEYVANTEMYEPQCGATGWESFSNGGWSEVYIREMDTRISPGDHRSLHLVERIYGFDDNGVPIWTLADSMNPMPFWSDFSLLGEYADGTSDFIEDNNRRLNVTNSNNGNSLRGRMQGVLTGTFEIEFNLGYSWGWSIASLTSAIQVAENFRDNNGDPYSHYQNTYYHASLYNNSSNNYWYPTGRAPWETSDTSSQLSPGNNGGLNVLWRESDGTIKAKAKTVQSHSYTFPTKFAGPLILSSGQQSPHSTRLDKVWNATTGQSFKGRNRWYK